jgi:hypothetical protein
MRICLLVMLIITSFCLVSCGHDREDSADIAPLHLEIDTQNLQPRVGLSGYIFGSFVLLNAFILIIVSCITLIVKEQTFKKISDTINMGMQMLAPSQDRTAPSSGSWRCFPTATPGSE